MASPDPPYTGNSAFNTGSGLSAASEIGSSGRKRCYSGCAICRARKVKCDERPAGCSNCERIGLQCAGNYGESWLPPTNSRLPPLAGVKRKKTYRSCLPCRSSKTRCSGDRPVCARCKRKTLECKYDSEPDPAWARAVFRSGLGRASFVTNDQRTMFNDVPDEMPSELKLAGKEPDPSTAQPAPPSSNPLAWLYMLILPGKEKLARLIEQYFANIYALRCFGFIHKPMTLQRLHEGPEEAEHFSNPTLYAVLALGAKFYALDYSINTRRLSPKEILAAGSQWAKEAQRLLFLDLDVASVEKLMAAVLLHDHELRVGRFAAAFMLSGLSTRMAQALQINVEYSTDILCITKASQSLSPACREARRRLMWAVYVMDTWVGSGVDQLTLFDDLDILVQLPCREIHFVRQNPVITEALEPNRVLKFVSPNPTDPTPFENLGMAAFFVRLTAYRRKVLRYVKHLDTVQPPWIANSEFSRLSQELENWYRTLPNTLQFTTSVIYIRKEASQLGALCLLHVAYHQTMCDLFRIGMPRLFKIRAKIHYPPERLDFLALVQQTCFYHAQQIASILKTACQHGVKMLADTWLAVVAHDANRVLLYYLTKVLSPTADANRNTVNETLPLIYSNLEVLKAMTPIFSMALSLLNASTNMLRQSGLGHGLNESMISASSNEPTSIEGPTAPGTPVQSTPDYIMNPLAIYRLARKAVPENEKHAPELIPSSNATRLSNENTAASPWGAGSAVPYDFPVPTHPPLNLPPGNTLRAGPVTGSEADLEMFFSSDFDHIWQPSSTVLEGSQWGGIAPWESNFGGADGGINNFVPPYSWPTTQ